MANNCIFVIAMVTILDGLPCSFPSFFLSSLVLLSFLACQVLRKSASTKIDESG